MYRKKLCITLSTILCILLLFPNVAFANLYAGNYETTTSYGAMADITTPQSLPYISSLGISGWADANTADVSKWIQAGARLRTGYTSFKSYYEYKTSVFAYDLIETSTHPLNTTMKYYVAYSPNSGDKWNVFIDGYLKATYSNFPEKMYLEVQGESHDSNNYIDFLFTNIKHWASTSSSWELISQDNHYAQSPYRINYYAPYTYQVYR